MTCGRLPVCAYLGSTTNEVQCRTASLPRPCTMAHCPLRCKAYQPLRVGTLSTELNCSQDTHRPLPQHQLGLAAWATANPDLVMVERQRRREGPV